MWKALFRICVCVPWLAKLKDGQAIIAGKLGVGGIAADDEHRICAPRGNQPGTVKNAVQICSGTAIWGGISQADGFGSAEQAAKCANMLKVQMASQQRMSTLAKLELIQNSPSICQRRVTIEGGRFCLIIQSDDHKAVAGEIFGEDEIEAAVGVSIRKKQDWRVLRWNI